MNLQKIRERHKLNQTEFWKRVGITQSGGSRYENEERPLPKSVVLLVNIAYGDDRAYKETLKILRP